MSRHYSSSYSSSTTKSSVGGSVDPAEHKVVPTRADIYTSRPPINHNQQARNLERAEPSVNLQVALQQNVRPFVASRSVIINRSVPDPFMRNSRLHQSERVYKVGSLSSIHPGSFAALTTSGVGAVVESRDKEKRDMQDLNERLANYLEKVRFLEAQNKNLACELERLKNKWGQETSQVKVMYQTEIDEARRLLDDAIIDKGKLEIKVASLEDAFEDLRGRLNDAIAAATEWKEKWEGMIQRVSQAEAEAEAMRRRTEGMESERERDKKTMKKLQDLLQSARQDLDNETLLHVEAASRLQTTEEELAFVKAIHEQEVKELNALIHHDSTPDNRAYWKNEMGAALKEIQEMYDEKLESLRTDMETAYNIKVQEFKTGVTKSSLENAHSREENKRLKTNVVELRDRLAHLEGQNLGLMRDLDMLRQDEDSRERELQRENDQLKSDVSKLRAEIDSVMHELQHIMDSKITLEMEISAYRKLLEGEEHRLDELETDMIKARKGQLKGSEENETDSQNSVKSQSQYSSSYRSSTKPGDTPRYSYQRTSKGTCGIAESSVDGKFLVIENTGRKDEDLGMWTINRIIDGVDQVKHTLDSKFMIRANSKVKLWSRGNKPYGASFSDVEAKIPNWGVGDTVITRLLSPNGEERATFTQKTAN